MYDWFDLCNQSRYSRRCNDANQLNIRQFNCIIGKLASNRRLHLLRYKPIRRETKWNCPFVAEIEIEIIDNNVSISDGEHRTIISSLFQFLWKVTGNIFASSPLIAPRIEMQISALDCGNIQLGSRSSETYLFRINRSRGSRKCARIKFER